MAKAKTKVAIYGCGGHGKVVLDILLESGAEVVGFVDDNKAKAGRVVCGVTTLGDLRSLRGRGPIAVALGIGDNKTRLASYERAKAAGLRVVSAVHPRAFVSRLATLREGVTVMAGAVVNPDAVLEEGVVVNTGATVDHDCRLGRFCQVWPGAHLAGAVWVGDLAYVGTGASVVPSIHIGAGALIGAGAAVVSDIPEGVTAAGVPAKVTGRRP